MQWLYAGSSEAPHRRGSGILGNRCAVSRTLEKVPHVGWNSLEVRAGSLLLAGVDGARVRRISPILTRLPITADTAATTQYIEPFAAAVERGNVMGVQFHPEKSGDTGLKILSNFLGGDAEKGICVITKRIIACLDVHAGRVVKGVQFVDIVDAGDPAELAARHAREGADEIVLLDITATHEGGRPCWIRCGARRANCLYRSAWVAGFDHRTMRRRCSRRARTR